jgi:hypothetical protein
MVFFMIIRVSIFKEKFLKIIKKILFPNGVWPNLVANIYATAIITLIPLISTYILVKIFKDFFEDLVKNPEYHNIITNLVYIFLFSVIITAIYLILAFKTKVLKRTILDHENELRRIDSLLGVKYILENTTEQEIENNYSIIRNKIFDTTSSKLDILLTTGYEQVSMHFPHDPKEFKEKYKTSVNKERKGIFHDYFTEIKVPTRILILKPDCLSARSRGSQVINDIPHYIDLICRTIAFLEKIRNSYVQYRFYDQTPVWNIIKNEKLAFVQPIMNDKKSRDGYIYCFNKINLSISSRFDTLFEKKWKEGKSLKIEDEKIRFKIKEFTNKYI